MDDEQLVVAVQRRSAIYDKTNPKHRNRDAVRLMWKECAAELETDEVERLKKRWGYLRDYFMKQYRDLKAIKSEQGMMKRMKWPLFDAMSFLIPYIEQRDNMSSSSLSIQQKAMDMETSCDSKASEEDFSTDVNTLPTQDHYVEEEPPNRAQNIQENLRWPPSSQLTSIKRPITNSQIFSHPKRHLYSEPTSFGLELLTALKERDAYDDDDHFFKSLKPMLQQLDPLRKLEFRIEVQNLLLKFLRSSDSSSSSTLQNISRSTPLQSDVPGNKVE